MGMGGGRSAHEMSFRAWPRQWNWNILR